MNAQTRPTHHLAIRGSLILLLALPVVSADPDSLYRAGVAAFERGEINASAEAFDALIAARPNSKPRLWQRGISLYYAQRFDDCIEQFVTHRTVNPDDAENSIWHFLCVAANESKAGTAKARAEFFPARDSRVPLMEAHRLFAGRGTVAQVLQRVDEAGVNPVAKRVRSFYAHLYIALWHESQGELHLTRKHLEQAVDGPAIGHYMERVAQVHLELIRAGKHWVQDRAATP